MPDLERFGGQYKSSLARNKALEHRLAEQTRELKSKDHEIASARKETWKLKSQHAAEIRQLQNQLASHNENGQSTSKKSRATQGKGQKTLLNFKDSRLTT